MVSPFDWGQSSLSTAPSWGHPAADSHWRFNLSPMQILNKFQKWLLALKDKESGNFGLFVPEAGLKDIQLFFREDGSHFSCAGSSLLLAYLSYRVSLFQGLKRTRIHPFCQDINVQMDKYKFFVVTWKQISWPMPNWGVRADGKMAQKWPKTKTSLKLEIENPSKSVKPWKWKAIPEFLGGWGI